MAYFIKGKVRYIEQGWTDVVLTLEVENVYQSEKGLLSAPENLERFQEFAFEGEPFRANEEVFSLTRKGDEIMFSVTKTLSSEPELKVLNKTLSNFRKNMHL